MSLICHRANTQRDRQPFALMVTSMGNFDSVNLRPLTACLCGRKLKKTDANTVLVNEGQMKSSVL